MTSTIKYHVATSADDAIQITPSPENTNVNPVHYIITGPQFSQNDLAVAHGLTDTLHLFFQNGTVQDGVPNGLTIEVLLAVCKHRLESFQEGPYTSAYNDRAIIYIEQAIGALHERTKLRRASGIEGTHTNESQISSDDEALRRIVESQVQDLELSFPIAHSGNIEPDQNDPYHDIEYCFVTAPWVRNYEALIELFHNGAEGIPPLDKQHFANAESLVDYMVATIKLSEQPRD